MKKEITLFLILALLIFPTVLAIDDNTTLPKEQLSAIAGGLDEKTEDVLEKEIQIPIFSSVLKVLFRLEDQELTWVNLIVLLAFSFFLFLLMSDFLTFTSFQESTGYFISAALVVMMGIMGIIKGVLFFVLNISETLNFFVELGVFGRIITALIIITILFFIHYVFNIKRRNAKLLRSKEFGQKIHQSKENIEKFSEEIINLDQEQNIEQNLEKK